MRRKERVVSFIPNHNDVREFMQVLGINGIFKEEETIKHIGHRYLVETDEGYFAPTEYDLGLR